MTEVKFDVNDTVVCPCCDNTVDVSDLDWMCCDYEWLSAYDLVCRWDVKCPECKSIFEVIQSMKCVSNEAEK